MQKLKTMLASLKTKRRQHLAAKEKLGLGWHAQRTIVKLGKQLTECTDNAKRAKLQRRGERVVDRGRARIRSRNAKKCWIEVKESQGGVHVFAAVYGTGYPADIPFEEAVRFAKMLNEHDDTTGIELTVQYGFGYQSIPIRRKMLPEARRQFNQVALDYCERLIAEQATGREREHSYA